jgi:hypothetical protein
MYELTIGSGYEASLYRGTLLGNVDGEAHLPGTLQEKCRRKLWRRVSPSIGARCGIWEVR